METLEHSPTFQKRLMQAVQGVPAALENQILQTLEKAIQDIQQADSHPRQPTQEEITAAWAALRQSNPFKELKDPVAWQREIRKDRDLPYRQ